jgi:hypothetical protein
MPLTASTVHANQNSLNSNLLWRHLFEEGEARWMNLPNEDCGSNIVLHEYRRIIG